jgi:hypothetical protein
MPAKNPGITLLSVVAAVGAFIVSSIWAQGLQKKVDAANHATDQWTATNDTVRTKEIDLEGNTPTDLTAAKQRLEQKLHLADQLDSASTPLIQQGSADLKFIDGSVALTEHLSRLETQSRTVDSLDSASAVDKEARKLLDLLGARGALMNSDVQTLRDELEKQESRTRHIGYALSILAIVVAGAAQLFGKG